MKCTRCGKEMTIKPLQTGTDENGDPVFTRYAFCYNCKIKVNLDKKNEREKMEKQPAVSVEETETTVKRKKKKGKRLPSISLPKRKGGREKNKTKKEKRGGGLLKFLIFFIIIAALGFAGYTYRRPIAKFVQQMYEKYVDQNDEEQVNEPENDYDSHNPEGSDGTTEPDIVEPQNENEPADGALEEGENSTPKTEGDGAQDTLENPLDGIVTEP